MSSISQRSDGRFLSKLFYRVLPAQIFLLMLTGINNIVDGMVATNFLSPTAMSTIGLYAPFQMIWLAVSSVLMIGSQVLCGRYMGAGDLQRTRGVFSLNITMAFTASAVAALLSFILPGPIAQILGASPVVFNDVSGYIVGRGVGLIPMVLGAQFVAFLSLEGQNKRNYAATSSMLAINIALDLYFAISHKEMGIMGLGIATSLSQWAYMIIAGYFFLTRKASLKYSFRIIRWKELWGMVKIGFPNAMVFFLNAIKTSTFNNLMAAYDPTMICVAVMSTYSMTMMIFESVGKGVAATSRLLTSVSYGEEDGRSITSIMKTVFTKGLMIAAAASVVTFLLSDTVAGLFYSEPGSPVFQMTAKALKIGAAVLIFETIAVVFSNYFQAIDRTVIVNIMSVLEGAGAMIPLGLLLIPNYGVDGNLLAFLIGYVIIALCGPVYAIFFWKRWPRNLSEWVTISPNFGAADDERLEASIHSLEEAVSTAKQVGDFCRERNIDEKKAVYSSLALEELCLGIIKERFETDPKKKHTIEVRIVHKGEDVFMSLKDDCKPFNPKDRAELVNPQDDSPKSISIRVFMGIVKETDYQLTLGINVFTVTI